MFWVLLHAYVICVWTFISNIQCSPVRLKSLFPSKLQSAINYSASDRARIKLWDAAAFETQMEATQQPKGLSWRPNTSTGSHTEPPPPPPPAVLFISINDTSKHSAVRPKVQFSPKLCKTSQHFLFLLSLFTHPTSIPSSDPTIFTACPE